MKKISKFLAVLVVVAVAGAAAPAYASHSWGTYHWARTTNPFTLKLGDDLSNAWDPYLATASADWNASSVVKNAIVSGQAGNPRTCKAVTGRVEVCNASYGNNGWLGLASIWADANGHITKGTTKMNDTYFNTATYNTPAWKRLVVCQEVAHTFGLGHQNEAFTAPNLGSCMDYTNDPDGGGAYGPSNEHPNQHDFDQLVTIYGGHVDGYTTLNATAAQIKALAKSLVVVDDQDEDVGKPTHFNKHGDADEYIKEYPNGSIKITHVFLLPQE